MVKTKIRNKSRQHTLLIMALGWENFSGIIFTWISAVLIYVEIVLIADALSSIQTQWHVKISGTSGVFI